MQFNSSALVGTSYVPQSIGSENVDSELQLPANQNDGVRHLAAATALS
jgi:hypothetical protein